MWPNPKETDKWLADARNGDQDAVNRLLEHHRQALRRLVQMRLDPKIQRRVDVSDVVQDALVDANRRLEDYLANPVMPFHLWLRNIARDRVIDAHRRHRASAKRSVDREQRMRLPAEGDGSTIDLAAQICDQEMTPASAVAMQELARRFEDAIEKLNEKDREVVVMRHFEQLSNQEVAQALGISEPATSMRYLRALRRLRELLSQSSSSS